MPANYVLLEKITVGAATAASVTFSGIPQTGYTDLVVKGSVSLTNDSIAFATFKFNGSSANFSSRLLEGSGSTVVSSSTSTGPFGVPGLNSYTNTFSNIETYIPNYTSSNFKSYSSDSVQEWNTTTVYMDLIAGLWSNTAAITSIEITPAAGNWRQYSTFYLYGVAKLGTTPAIVPYATGGDTIMTDGTYWYHAFTSSGTFTPQKGLSCDVLVVAGGGGGGHGGGGAGGLYYSSANSVTTTGYTVTVGAGGAGASASRTTRGTNGSDSQFGSLTAAVGGGGGGNGTIGVTTGANGGSGGGGAMATGQLNAAGGTGTSGQGNAGGTGGTLSGNYGAGGGGGAGATGTNGSSAAGGAGGAGSNTYSSWATTTGTGVSGYYAGGGGGGADASGGAGGSGGGGAGTSSTPTNGTANTGGGGGGTSNVGGGSGGSGLVIVRYAV